MSESPQKTIITCSGLGAPQLGELEIEIQSEFPSANLEHPLGNDQYHADLFQLVQHGHPTALIGHSFGVDAVVDCLWDLDKWDLRAQVIYLIEPVWRTKRIPTWAWPICRWLQCDAWFDFPKAEVVGVTKQVIPHTDHNSICHDPAVMNAIISDIRKM